MNDAVVLGIVAFLSWFAGCAMMYDWSAEKCTRGEPVVYESAVYKCVRQP